MPEETAPAIAAPEFRDQQEYKVWRETGKTPAAAEPEKPQPETSEGSEAETPKPPETASESETDEEKQEQEKDESSKSRRGIEKRFHDLTAEIRALKQQLAAKAEPGIASPKAEPESEPQVTEFEEYADYVRALSKYTATQAAREAAEAAKKAEQHRTAVETWNEREKAVRAKHADYDEVLASVDDIIFRPEVGEALRDSELGPQIAYHLAQNRAECERLSKLYPYQVVREIGKLEAKLTPAPITPEPPKAPKLSAAPEPIKPVNGSTAASTKKPDQMDYQEYKRYREEQLKLRRA